MTFFGEASKHLGKIGAIAASSRFLGERMARIAQAVNPVKVIELGAGTGALTRPLLAGLSSEARVVAFEIHPLFAEDLERLGDLRLSVKRADAASLVEVFGAGQTDVVLSGLPIALFPEMDRSHLLKEIGRALRPGGVYIQFQYSLKNVKDLRRAFSDVRISFELFNLPPAFVFACRRPRS